MSNEVDYQFHAQLLLKNPAWGKALEEMRAQLARERDGLDWNSDERHYVSIAQTLLTKLERRVEGMAAQDNVAKFHQRQAGRVI